MSKVVSLPPRVLRDAGIRRVVHELPPGAALPGALLFSLIGHRLMDVNTHVPEATEPAATGTGDGR